MEQVLGMMLLLGSTASMPSGMRIIGGSECVPHSQPWHVFIYNSQLTRCGGILIKENWVLTAGHCLGSEMRIHLGEHDLRKNNKGEQLSTAVRVIRHPDFESETLKNDLMLLQLDPPAVLSKTVQLIPMIKECVPTGTKCVVSGWGTITYPEVNYAYTLTCADVEVLPKDICQATYEYYFAEKQLCAGILEGGTDSCRGDSGSPLTCNGVVHGMVSWGPDECGATEQPAVYTELCQFTEWIEETLSLN